MPSPDLSTADAQRRLQYCAIEDLAPNKHNPRRHKPDQILAIARSIQSFGFNAPILIDCEGTILAGHGRLEAAKLLELAEVPVISLDELTPAQAKAYMLADNKLTDRSSWDDGLLAVHLKELSELALDFEVEDTGFELPEIDLRIQGLEPELEADKADKFEVVSGPAVSRPGDLWLLGPHKLYCGNALDAEVYDALLGGERAAGVFTDPPYNVRIEGNVSGLGAVTHREFAMASGEMSKGEFTQFLATSLELLKAHTEAGSLIYACMDWRHLEEMAAAGTASQLELVNLCVWVKTNGGMGSLYRSQHELVFAFRNGDETRCNNVQLGRFGRNRSNVWNYPGANSFPRKGKEKSLTLHPTIKPIALVADAIFDSTNPDEIVLDPFLGSGTTILAAEKAHRRCYGIELDPIYVDTAIMRWQRLTGKQAILSSGEVFGDITALRSAA